MAPTTVRNGSVTFAVSGETRSAMRKLAGLIGLIVRDGVWTPSARQRFAVLAEFILQDIDREPRCANPASIGEIFDETPIFPTPESEASL